ncbi:NAD(P)/FAD-dependent oxidoreductase [Amycolatopsis jejuensis]|uniref:NAD(P)/FAD-dependent oxidoreductase n=1 Tax=Amycolatopsis jejuensis TaxID=330084 RepID=UPI00068F0551|nr:FAD-dependent oxidoreductase [Amycolatopsis jejuensis]
MTVADRTGGARNGSFDVVVVGGGVLGCAVAARLSRTSARVCLLEAEPDVAEGASKGNAGVAVSYYGAPETAETRLITASNPGWEDRCRRLDVPYRRIGAVMVALDDEQALRLEHTRAEVSACGVPCAPLTAAEVRELEPLVGPRCVAGLHLPDEGIIDPMRLTVAYAQVAVRNGGDLRLGTAVSAIRHHSDGTSTVTTSAGTVHTRFVVNAAGTGAGWISELAGGEPLRGWPRQGQYAVLDRAFGSRLSKIVFCTHGTGTKGINVVPTTHGSALLGPTAQDIEDPGDRATDPGTIAHILAQVRDLVPAAAQAPVIKTFAANRPAGDEPHRLRIDSRVPNLLHLTNRSAGVSISPAAAEEVLALLQNAGLDADDRPEGADRVRPVPRLRTAPDPSSLVELDPLYGQVVCACEQVSAAEINHALEDAVPACSVDGIRKRTGAGYGRCQGSLCLAGLTFLTGVHTGTGPAATRQTARGTVGS